VTTREEKDRSALIKSIRDEWKTLWCDRIDDKVRAEGVANRSFQLLCVEQGTVIVATRDFKPLDLRKILYSQGFQDDDRFLGPSPLVGGWTKFARTVLNKQARARIVNEGVPCRRHLKNMQLKQGGRGWLHLK
jgi:hypothetical protein